MRLSRLATLVIAVAAAGACGSDNITTPGVPPLAGVRFINGLADSSAVDVRMIDQVEWSLNGVQNIAFRSGTEHQPVEAKARQIRVFPNSNNPVITSAFMVDTSITFAANSRYTLLLTRETATHVHLIVINDDAPAPATGQVAIRAVNASTGAIDAYVVDTTTTPISGAPAAANLAAFAASGWVGRAAARAALTVTPAGSATVSATRAGPPSTNAPTPAGENPIAGVYSAGTALSAFYFPRSVAGTSAPQTTTPAPSFLAPAIVWFVDRNPAQQ
jgi:hypothetical protein